MKWTDAQQSAIDAPRPGQLPSQTILVSAAAGSGKTAVLVERMIQRLKRRRAKYSRTDGGDFHKGGSSGDESSYRRETSGRVSSYRGYLFRRTIEYVAVRTYFHLALLLPMGYP